MSGETVRDAIAKASLREVNGGELESIGTIYKPEGVGIIIANALGIDPDMPLDTLRRRLRIAERVEVARAAARGADGVS